MADAMAANATLFGDARYTFSLSLAPNAASTSAVPFSIPAALNHSVSGPTSSTAVQDFSGDRIRLSWQTSYFNNGDSTAYVTSGGADAPNVYAYGGQQYAGEYFVLRARGTSASVQSNAYINFTDLNTSGGAAGPSQIKSMAVLWGSVQAGDLIRLTGSPTHNISLSGAEVLAAAAALGITGNEGSYYVTINAVGDNSFRQVRFQTSHTHLGQTFQVAPLSYSKELMVVNEVLVPPPMPVSEPLQGVPAPVVGATPVGGALAMALLGFVGLGKRRRAAREATYA